MRAWKPASRVAAFALALAALASSTVQAGPCAGFDDVDTSTSYCSGVQWLKARGITLGCDATHYCPNDVVSRASMALFLQRAGTALTPQFYSKQESVAADNMDNGDNLIYCQLAIPAATYPRTARATATWQGASYPKPPTMHIAYQPQGGSWFYAGSGLYLWSVANSTLAADAYAASLTFSAPTVSIAADTAYTFTVWLSNSTGSAVFFQSSSCFIDVMLVSGG